MLLVVLCTALTGCEFAKVILGTSTRKLEEARRTAEVAKYECTFEQCFDAVLSLAHNGFAGEPVSGEPYFDVFQKDRIKSYIVAMGVPGQINTTEVGIFFVTLAPHTMQIEVSSLSSGAKQKVARRVFQELGMRFKKIP